MVGTLRFAYPAITHRSPADLHRLTAPAMCGVDAALDHVAAAVVVVGIGVAIIAIRIVVGVVVIITVRIEAVAQSRSEREAMSEAVMMKTAAVKGSPPSRSIARMCGSEAAPQAGGRCDGTAPSAHRPPNPESLSPVPSDARTARATVRDFPRRNRNRPPRLRTSRSAGAAGPLRSASLSAAWRRASVRDPTSRISSSTSATRL